MRAAVPGKPGQVEIVNLPDPVLEKGDILIAPRSCGVCATDVKFVKAGAEQQKYALGHEVAGVVIKTTPGSSWQVGQKVVVAPYLPCGGCYYCRHGQPALCKDLYKVSLQPGGIAEEVLVPKRLAEEGSWYAEHGSGSIMRTNGVRYQRHRGFACEGWRYRFGHRRWADGVAFHGSRTSLWGFHGYCCRNDLPPAECG